MKREDGFYWIRYWGDWTVAEWRQATGKTGGWWLTGGEDFRKDSVLDEICERVQRDSDLVKQRDEAVEALKEAIIVCNAYEGVASGESFNRPSWNELLARIESAKSGVPATRDPATGVITFEDTPEARELMKKLISDHRVD